MSAGLGDQPVGADELNLVQVAQRLNMSVRTVGRWARSGRIPPAIGCEGTWLFRMADVDTVSLHGASGRVTEPDELGGNRPEHPGASGADPSSG
ncbi:MAG: Helix-turn-helix domain [Acidimicrobiaceae bacterium]|nr:Helix-turn-helix domain [Acidimicrobiaceae bacterium]